MRVCVPECPVDAIKPDTEPGLEKWLRLNAEYAKVWPNVTMKKPAPPDSKDSEGKPDKRLQPRPCATMVSYRQVQVIDARSGASGVTMRGFGMFREFAGAVHGSTHTPASSMS